MKFSTTVLSSLAFALTINALPKRGLIQPIFTCSSPDFGGCCTSFLEDGIGVGCYKANMLKEGIEKKYICNNSNGDHGIPACCYVITTPPGTHIGIPLPCQELPLDY